MGIIWLLLVGLVAGWLAGVLVQGRGYGVVADIILGILGAVLGGAIFNALGVGAYGTIGNILVALVGALILIAIVKAVHKAA